MKAYRVCVAYFLRLLAKVELPLSAKDLVNTLAIENGDPRFVLLDFIDEDLGAFFKKRESKVSKCRSSCQVASLVLIRSIRFQKNCLSVFSYLLRFLCA